MGFAQWMRVLDTIGGLVQLAGRGRRTDGADLPTTVGGGPLLGQLEARLTGVVVAALKEAFDRDSARLELERSQIEAERQRAEMALRAELRRQAGERALVHLRTIAVMAVLAVALSAVLAVWLPGMRDGIARALLGGGWLLALGALGSAFAGWRRVSDWSSDTQGHAGDGPRAAALDVAPWLLLGALALTCASLLAAL